MAAAIILVNHFEYGCVRYRVLLSQIIAGSWAKMIRLVCKCKKKTFFYKSQQVMMRARFEQACSLRHEDESK